MGRPAASADVHPAGRRALERRFQIAPGPRRRAPRVVLGVVELVQRARGGVDHDGVAVAGGALSSFDRGVGAEGIRPRVALARVLERDVHEGMAGRYHGVGHAVGVGRVARRPEVGMQERRRGIHAGEPLGAVHVDRQGRDVGVPDVVGWEHVTWNTGRSAGQGGRYTPHGCQGPAAHDQQGGGQDRRSTHQATFSFSRMTSIWCAASSKRASAGILSGSSSSTTSSMSSVRRMSSSARMNW